MTKLLANCWALPVRMCLLIAVNATTYTLLMSSLLLRLSAAPAAAAPLNDEVEFHASGNGPRLALERQEGKLDLLLDGEAEMGTLVIYRAASLELLTAAQSVAARINTIITPGMRLPLATAGGAGNYEFFVAQHFPGVLSTNPTFGPEILETELAPADDGTYTFTLRSHLGGGGSAAAQRDQYTVTVIGPDGKLVEGVQWSGAMANATQTQVFSAEGQQAVFHFKLPPQPITVPRYGIVWGALRQVIRPLTIIDPDEECCLAATPEISALRTSDLNRGWQETFGFVEVSGAAVDISAIGTPAPLDPKITNSTCEKVECLRPRGPAGGEQTDIERDFRVIDLTRTPAVYTLIISSGLVPQVSQRIVLIAEKEYASVDIDIELGCDNAPQGGFASVFAEVRRLPDTVIIADRPIWDVGSTLFASRIQTNELTIHTENKKLLLELWRPHTLRMSARRESSEFGEAYAIMELNIAP